MDDYSNFEDVILVNRGAVEANDPNIDSRLSLSFIISPPTSLINSGVIRAIDGATLNIEDDNSVIQNYELDEFGNVLAGKIQATVGSEVRLKSVSGGILQADAGGVIRVEKFGYLGSHNTPTEIQLLGRIEAESISLEGKVRNDGQLVVSGSIANFDFFNAPTQPLRLLGNGELQLNGTLFTRNSTFLNGPEHTIIGSGNIRSGASFFTNEGRIEANDNNTLNIFHTGPAFLFQQRGELISSGNGVLNIKFEGPFSNRGTVRVDPGATTHFIGDLSSSGHQLVNATGAEIVVDGQLFAENSDLVNEAGATIRGDGQIELVAEPLESPRFFNHGTLAPGNPLGQLTILGDFEQSSTGELEIELGGTASEEYDSLAVWSAVFAGQLEVSLADLGEGEFEPALGNTFTIIELFNGPGEELLSGEFDTFLLPALATDLLWGIQYNPESVVLEILAPLLADLDGDGDVDGNDFLLVQRDDPALIPQWQAEFGSRVIESLGNSQAVPEPSTALLALIAFVAIEGAVREAIQARHN